MRGQLIESNFTERGQYLRVGGLGGVFYNMENGLAVSKEEADLLQHEVFTSDGAYYIAWNTVRHALTGQIVYTGIVPTCFNADDKLLCIDLSQGVVRVIDWRYRKAEGEYQFSGMIPDTAVLYKRLAILFCIINVPATGLYKIDFNTFEQTLISPSAGGRVLNCSYDARKVILATGPNQLRVFNVETGSHVDIPESMHAYNCKTSFTKDGKYLIALTGIVNTLRIYDTDTGKLRADITAQSAVFNATFIGDDTKITTVHEDGTIGLWDFVKGELIKQELLRAY